MVDQAIVTFIDILGYGEIVKRHSEDIKVIKEIEQLWTRITDICQYKGMPALSIPRDYIENIIKTMNIRFISDSFIFTLNLSHITPDTRYSDAENLSNHIFTYFYSIAAFCPAFIGKMGHVFKGGISIGPHYEKDLSGNKNIFIFSQAYNNAYKLQEKQKEAKIVGDSNLLTFLRTIEFRQTREFFKRNRFELYYFLQFTDKEKQGLRDIKEGVTLNIKTNLKDKSSKNYKKIKKHLYSFVIYHNKTIKRAGDNFKEFIIDESILK